MGINVPHTSNYFVGDPDNKEDWMAYRTAQHGAAKVALWSLINPSGKHHDPDYALIVSRMFDVDFVRSRHAGIVRLRADAECYICQRRFMCGGSTSASGVMDHVQTNGMLFFRQQLCFECNMKAGCVAATHIVVLMLCLQVSR